MRLLLIMEGIQCVNCEGMEMRKSKLGPVHEGGYQLVIKNKKEFFERVSFIQDYKKREYKNGKNPFSVVVSPNPTASDTIRVEFTMPYETSVNYMISTLDGKVVEEGDIEGIRAGVSGMNFDISSANTEFVIITFVFDDKFYVSEKVIKKQ